MRLYVIITAGLALVSDQGMAQTTHGSGTLSCGKWLEERRAGGWPDINSTHWLTGFLSAYNVYGPGKGNIAGSVDRAGMTAWIEQYCVNNPTNTLTDAAVGLVKHLRLKGRD